MKNNLKRIFKIFGIQLLVFIPLISITLLAIFELGPLLKTSSKKGRDPKICKDFNVNNIEFLYIPCPNSSYQKAAFDPRDPLKRPITWIDNRGGRTNFESWKKIQELKSQKIFIIGDSFIEADEIDYEDTIYGLINKFSKNEFAYGLGFSSWNPKQYLSAVKSISKKDSFYDIYLVPNDFSPLSGRSVYAENRRINNKHTDFPETKKKSFEPIKYIKSKLQRLNSYQALYEFKRFIQTGNVKGDRVQSFWEKHKKAYQNKDCKFLEDPFIDKLGTQMKDIIAYTFPYKCWNSMQKEAYKETKDVMKEIVLETEKLHSEVRFIFIPIPFAYKNENTKGRTSLLLLIPNNVTISLTGLFEKLKEDFGETFVNPELALKKEKNNNCPLCKDKYFFEYDGHLTDLGHKFHYEELYLNQDWFKNIK